MQTWWDKKLVLMLGLVGALLLMGQSVLGTLVWPVYNAATYPLAVLMANYSPYRLSFMVLNGLAAFLLLLSLGAILKEYHRQQQAELMKSIERVMLAVGLWMGFQLVWPLTKPAAAIMGGEPIRNGFAAVIILWLMVSLYRYSLALRPVGATSLANVLFLMGILFLVFHGMTFGMQLIGWPLQGFFDVLANDCLAAGLGFADWYYLQQGSR